MLSVQEWVTPTDYGSNGKTGKTTKRKPPNQTEIGNSSCDINVLFPAPQPWVVLEGWGSHQAQTRNIAVRGSKQQ